MYNFIDVNEVSEGMSLPSEALQINGEFIENQIPGYRTLQVTGRESLSPELLTYETGVKDGVSVKNKRYPERIITVKYQLIAKTSEEFRTAFNKLAGILSVTEAELIFNDELDKFYTGTPSNIGTVEGGLNSVVSEFEIYCANPFKYSVVEYEATSDFIDGSILVDYNGTYKSFPVLEAEFYNETEESDDGETVLGLSGLGDCGYVAFFNENEKIIQLGNPDEVDGIEAYKKSQTLVNATFKTSKSFGKAAKSQWIVNGGITSGSNLTQAGNAGMDAAFYETPESESTKKNTTGTLLIATSKAAKPYVNYTLKAKVADRTANSIKLVVAVTAALESAANYFGRGFGLKGHLYIGGKWNEFTIKSTTEYWRGKTGHTKNVTVVITGITEKTNAITGIKFKATRTDSAGKTGVLNETACSNFVINEHVEEEVGGYYLTSKDFGTGEKWHGASITRVIPADASGAIGAKNFSLTYSQKMSIGNTDDATKQFGAFSAWLVSGTGEERKLLAGINIFKGSTGKKAKLRFYVNGKLAHNMDISVSYNNKHFISSKTTTIKKVNGKIQFDVCGIKKTFTDDDIENVAVREITFMFSQYNTRPKLDYNGLFWVKFVKNNCNTLKDIPNKFSANDVVTADCSSGKIFLNGVLEQSLGALGNDWEGLYLVPGLNQIGFSYSDWVEDAYAPKFKVRYREVFL